MKKYHLPFLVPLFHNARMSACVPPNMFQPVQPVPNTVHVSGLSQPLVHLCPHVDQSLHMPLQHLRLPRRNVRAIQPWLQRKRTTLKTFTTARRCPTIQSSLGVYQREYTDAIKENYVKHVKATNTMRMVTDFHRRPPGSSCTNSLSAHVNNQ